MGTVAGVNTRRYHGLLIATLNPPSDRYSILPRIEEIVEIGERRFELATVQYPGTVSPAGYQLLESFSYLPYPTWRYRCDSLTIEKSIRLIEGEQSVAISYSASGPCKIKVRLFISFRDYHGLSHQNSSLNPAVKQASNRLTVNPYQDLPPLTFHYSSAVFEASGAWFNNHEYLRELERGLDFREDLYSPGVLHFDLSPDVPYQIVASLGNSVPKPADLPPTFISPLSRALDQFRVFRADGRPTLIAGYPWFTDWGRDTLISLPAFIVSGFPAIETRSILEFLLSERKQGILPNRFSDRQSTPEFNTADASLWFFVAANAYVAATEDYQFVRETLLSAALDIIGWHQKGTFYAIHVDPVDNLLSAGQDGTQLTWMDAKVGDHVVTPRIGKPVEINALWFNALRITAHWAMLSDRPDIAGHLSSAASATRTSFEEKFWNPTRGCLYDVLTSEGPDQSLRPNQLFSLSLPYPLLDRVQGQSIVEVVRQVLLTPAGLRTLEPEDVRYCPVFAGNMACRDAAYHQGTVWPWLAGPYVEAYLYAFNGSHAAKKHCREVVQSLLELTSNYCLGTIAEVYDAQLPQKPGGCPAQLWSVAQTVLALRSTEESHAS